ncbi:hypothetical protein PUN28_000631 [Cardiocondyla obscurior]|uniref:Uncharacterized protein n=1 Tax=Cardiocondyla obscurior TaxID=286306 RepID=A0AAW2H0E6_9HYME
MPEFNSVNYTRGFMDLPHYQSVLPLAVEITRGHRRGYGKIRYEIYVHDVASIFPHTYIHFPSTSSMRYIASLRDDVGDPEFAFPRKIRQGRVRGSERRERKGGSR